MDRFPGKEVLQQGSLEKLGEASAKRKLNEEKEEGEQRNQTNLKGPKQLFYYKQPFLKILLSLHMHPHLSAPLSYSSPVCELHCYNSFPLHFQT